MAKGQCNCGAVSFSVQEKLTDVYMCHCSICRRWSGHSGMAVVVVPNEAFQWTSGEACISQWKKPDADWMSYFCRVCGSALPGSNDPDRMFVPAGLLTEGTENLRVAHHIWVGSKAPWDTICDDGRQHQEAFGQ
ncbi:MAG: GFA family protein [Pseudomonadota bacterium]